MRISYKAGTKLIGLSTLCLMPLLMTGCVTAPSTKAVTAAIQEVCLTPAQQRSQPPAGLRGDQRKAILKNDDAAGYSCKDGANNK